MVTSNDMAALRRAFSAQLIAKNETSRVLHKTFPPGAAVRWKYRGAEMDGIVLDVPAEACSGRLPVRCNAYRGERVFFIRVGQILDALDA